MSLFPSDFSFFTKPFRLLGRFFNYIESLLLNPDSLHEARQSGGVIRLFRVITKLLTTPFQALFSFFAKFGEKVKSLILKNAYELKAGIVAAFCVLFVLFFAGFINTDFLVNLMNAGAGLVIAFTNLIVKFTESVFFKVTELQNSMNMILEYAKQIGDINESKQRILYLEGQLVEKVIEFQHIINQKDLKIAELSGSFCDFTTSLRQTGRFFSHCFNFTWQLFSSWSDGVLALTESFLVWVDAKGSKIFSVVTKTVMILGIIMCLAGLAHLTLLLLRLVPGGTALFSQEQNRELQSILDGFFQWTWKIFTFFRKGTSQTPAETKPSLAATLTEKASSGFTANDRSTLHEFERKASTAITLVGQTQSQQTVMVGRVLEMMTTLTLAGLGTSLAITVGFEGEWALNALKFNTNKFLGLLTEIQGFLGDATGNPGIDPNIVVEKVKAGVPQLEVDAKTIKLNLEEIERHSREHVSSSSVELKRVYKDLSELRSKKLYPLLNQLKKALEAAGPSGS